MNKTHKPIHDFALKLLRLIVVVLFLVSTSDIALAHENIRYLLAVRAAADREGTIFSGMPEGRRLNRLMDEILLLPPNDRKQLGYELQRVKDVILSSRACFDKMWSEQTREIVVTAPIHAKFSKKIKKEVYNFLCKNAALSPENAWLNVYLIGYALENNLLGQLPDALLSIEKNQQIMPALIYLSSALGLLDELAGEILLKEDRLKAFILLHSDICLHIFSDLLPERANLSDKWARALVDAITHFTTSHFARRDASISGIYQQYREDYEFGRIKTLPAHIPSSRIIKVATSKAQALSDDAKGYYDITMQSIWGALSALDAKEEAGKVSPRQKVLVELRTLIMGKIGSLENRQKTSENSVSASVAVNKQISILKETLDMISGALDDNSFVILSFERKHIAVLGAIKKSAPLLSELLFIHALRENSSWRTYFRAFSSQPASLTTIKQYVEFMDSFIKPYILNAMPADARKKLLKHISSNIFKKEEIDRLSGVRGELTKRIRIVPCRGWLAEFIGYFSDECWTRTSNILRDNPDVIPLIFTDAENGDILGGTLLFPNAVEGTKVIIDRGLSPRTEVTDGLNINDFMDRVTDYEEEIAQALGAKRILVPFRVLKEGLGTNNPDIIQYYERNLSTGSAVNLDISNCFNDHEISQGKCVVLREIQPDKESHYVLKPYVSQSI